MGTEKINKELANKVYDVLEEIGASSVMRDAFIHTQTTEECREWRFMGALGFGGKFWNEYSYINNKYEWRVSCYLEDENPKREKIIKETNKKLKELADEVSKSKGNTNRI
ncbi:MAG: hypothetical protein WC554_09695 [Clostridia bacterium]